MKLVKKNNIIAIFIIFAFLFSCSKIDNPDVTIDTGQCATPYDAILTMYIDGKLITYDSRAELMNDNNTSKRFLKAESCSRAFLIDGSPVISFENDGIEYLEEYQIIGKKLYDANDISYGTSHYGGSTCYFNEDNVIKYYQVFNDYFGYIDENGDYTTNLGQFDLKSRLNYQIVNLHPKNDITNITKCDVNFSGVLYRTGDHNDSIIITQGRIRY